MDDKFSSILHMAWGGKHTTHDLAKLLLELPAAPLNAYENDPISSRSDPLFPTGKLNAWIVVEASTIEDE